VLAAAPSTPRGRAHSARKVRGHQTALPRLTPTPSGPSPSRTAPQPAWSQRSPSASHAAMSSGAASATAQAQAHSPERNDRPSAAAAADAGRITRSGPLSRYSIIPWLPSSRPGWTSRDSSRKPPTSAMAMATPNHRAGRSGTSQRGGRSASARQPASATARTTAVTGGRLTVTPRPSPS
jgi:hypothetical protein